MESPYFTGQLVILDTSGEDRKLHKCLPVELELRQNQPNPLLCFSVHEAHVVKCEYVLSWTRELKKSKHGAAKFLQRSTPYISNYVHFVNINARRNRRGIVELLLSKKQQIDVQNILRGTNHTSISLAHEYSASLYYVRETWTICLPRSKHFHSWRSQWCGALL